MIIDDASEYGAQIWWHQVEMSAAAIKLKLLSNLPHTPKLRGNGFSYPY